MSCTPRRIWNNSLFRISLVSLCCLAFLAVASFGLRSFKGSAAPAELSREPLPLPAPTAAPVQASAAAASALQRLRQLATSPVKAHVSRETENYDFVRAQGGVLAVDNVFDSPESRGFAFLRNFGDVIGMTAVERQLATAGTPLVEPTTGSVLKVSKVVRDSIGGAHVRFNQSYRGVLVFGAEVVVHMNNRGITAINGAFVPDIKISTQPRLTPAQAAATAVRAASDGQALNVVKTELGIYREGLLEGYQGQSVLAYNVTVSDGHGADAQIWLDAVKGTLLNRIPLTHKALYRTIYSPQYDPNNPGLFVIRNEGDPALPGPTPGTTGANPRDNLYEFAGQTYNLFASAFGRDSYDGAGHKMASVLLVSTNPSVPCPNAFWNGLATNYCPDFDADDVVAHEWGHAYTQFTHGLIYSYQAGGLNEAYSDIFGETVDLINGLDAEGGSNNSQPMPDGQRWQVGDDVPTINSEAVGLLRDMWTPTRYGNPDKVSSPNYDCAADAVHTTSGVPGHAFAILVDGKTFNGQTVTGIGLTRALHIYYRAMTVYQTPTTSFPLHAEALESSCQDLIGQPLNALSTTSPAQTVSGEVITAQMCQEVTKAMDAVEMRTDVAVRCNYQPVLAQNTPDLCPGATNIFSEDWETGTDGWTLTSTGVTADWNDGTRNLRDWTIDSTLPESRPGSAAYARNIALGEPGGGTCSAGGDYSGQFTIDSSEITIPAEGENLKMSFDHYVASEATFDGGQVEISINNGAFQLVPQDQYEFNGPNAAFAATADGNTNPNAGEFAWNGTDEGTFNGSWGTTIINLATLTNPGDTIRLRFTFSQDGCNGIDGWYVDNVRVFYCPTLEAPVLTLGNDYQQPDTDGTYTLTWTRPATATGPDTIQQSTQSCAPLLFDDAESGLGQWTVTTTGTATPGLAWEVVSNDKPQTTGSMFRARGANAVNDAASLLTYNNPLSIPATGQTFLTFSDWNVNEGDDAMFVEVSTDGTNWNSVYLDSRSELLPDGAAAFATEPLFNRTVNLAAYAGQTIRVRFRYQMGAEDRSGSIPLGWYLDNIAIRNENWSDVVTTSGTSHLLSGVPNGTRCYRVRTTYVLSGQNIASPYSNLVTAIVDASAAPDIDPFGLTIVNESCPSANNQVDPGERVTVDLKLINNGTAGTSNLVATLQSSANVIAPSEPQSYGALAPNANATRSYSFTADGSPGSMIPVTLQLQDGANNLGTATFNITLGNNSACRIVRLIVSSTLTRTDASTVKAVYTVQNAGAIAANDVKLTNAQLGSTTGTPLPQSLGNLAPGATSTPMEVFFTNSTPGVESTLTLEGTYTGGTFSSAKRVNIP